MIDRCYFAKRICNNHVERPISSRAFAWLAIIATIGAIISFGFVMGARQHFEAVALGYQTEQLRQQAQSLEIRKRQVELERARLASPIEIQKRALEMGLRPAQQE
jgi:hypothetical protein